MNIYINEEKILQHVYSEDKSYIKLAPPELIKDHKAITIIEMLCTLKKCEKDMQKQNSSIDGFDITEFLIMDIKRIIEKVEQSLK